jgi:uncharacterized protein (DUF433 family)
MGYTHLVTVDVEHPRVHDIFRGAYAAERAAALSGVPRSTLYYWAAHAIWEPSLRRTRPRLWTYADVLALRMIHWLRHPKKDDVGLPVKPSTMQQVRGTLLEIRSRGHDIWETDIRVLVDRGGNVFFQMDAGVWNEGQAVLPDALDLLGEFAWSADLRGPNLVRPRPTLRIVPGKLSGEPHVGGTRIATRNIAALVADGIGVESVLSLYPDLQTESIADSVDLEQQLRANAA